MLGWGVAEPPSVGIVTVNYNSARYIREFVASLRKVDYANMRLIVVDAGSHDGSEGIVEQFPGAHLIRAGENIGIAGGNNIGARYCLDQGFDHILFLNQDTQHSPDFLRTLVAWADDHTMVVPRILYAADPSLINTHAGDFDWTFGRFRNTFHGKADSPTTRVRRDVQTASFCCMLVPTPVFKAAGPLDERFFMYYEETDFLRRAIEMGFRVSYVPEAVVLHEESAASGGGWMTPFKCYYATRNRPYLVKKYASSRVRFGMFSAYFCSTRLVHATRFAMSRQWSIARAMILGLVDYYRGRMGRTLQVQDF
jgi:GT2 family glycosyltransferase